MYTAASGFWFGRPGVTPLHPVRWLPLMTNLTGTAVVPLGFVPFVWIASDVFSRGDQFGRKPNGTPLASVTPVVEGTPRDHRRGFTPGNPSPTERLPLYLPSARKALVSHRNPTKFIGFGSSGQAAGFPNLRLCFTCKIFEIGHDLPIDMFGAA